MNYQKMTTHWAAVVPQPHERLRTIPLENGDLLRHLEQLWDEVQILKREVRELKKKQTVKFDRFSNLPSNGSHED